MPDRAEANIGEITYRCGANDMVFDVVNRNGRSGVLSVTLFSAARLFTWLGVKVR